MRCIVSIIGAACLLIGTGAAEPLQPQHTDEIAVTAAVMDYFEGQGEASAERLDRAFARDVASMVALLPGEDGEPALRAWKDMGPMLDAWANNPGATGEPRDGEILSLEIVDGRIATVLFRSADRFFDALTLIKVEGQWKIVAKAFVLQEGA